MKWLFKIVVVLMCSWAFVGAMESGPRRAIHALPPSPKKLQIQVPDATLRVGGGAVNPVETPTSRTQAGEKNEANPAGAATPSRSGMETPTQKLWQRLWDLLSSRERWCAGSPNIESIVCGLEALLSPNTAAKTPRGRARALIIAAMRIRPMVTPMAPHDVEMFGDTPCP